MTREEAKKQDETAARGREASELDELLSGEMTDEEMESCWYCAQCDRPMRDNDKGVVKYETSFCSDKCVEDYEAKF